MVQRVEVIGVGIVEFPDGMSQEDMAAALRQLPVPKAEAKAEPKAAPAPAPKKPAPVEGTYGLMGEGIDDTVPTPTPKPKAVAPKPQIDPTTGKPYPEAVAAPEPSIWDRVMMWGGDNKAKAANEYAARRTAAERKIPVSEAYKITPQASRPMFNPEGRALGQAVVEAGEAVTKSLPDVPEAMANTALRAIRNGDIPVKDRTWLDKAITATTIAPKKGEANVEAFANIGQSLGYSATTMVASALATAAGTVTAGPVTGVAAGFGTSGAVAYRGSKDEFLGRLKEKLDKDSENTFGRKLNETEWNSAKKEFDSAASKYGAWEAVPEALSNLIFLKVFLAPVKTASKLEQLADYAKRALVTQPPEHITETVTALGQNKAELEAGLTKEELRLKDAFKQQFIQTLAIGGGMTVGTVAAKQLNNFYETYVEPKVRPGSALARAIQADLTDYLNQSARPQTPTVASANIQPPLPPSGPRLTELEAARRPELETEAPPDRTLSALEAARNEGIEVAAPPAPPAPPVDPRKDALVKSYVERGFMQDDAELMATQQLAALTAPPESFQDTTEQAVRSVLQAEASNVPIAEPPPYVTEPTAGEQGIGLPSEPTGGTAGVPADPIERGLGAAERLIESAIGREERERASLEANKQRVASQLANAFNKQAYPNLAPIFGASWMRETMAANPTPEEFQEAAYAKLEELDYLGKTPTGTYEAPAAPVTEEVQREMDTLDREINRLKQEEPRPLTLKERAEVRASLVESLDEQGLTEEEKAGFLQRFDKRTQKQQETPSVTEAPKAVESVKEKIFNVQRTQPEAKPGDAIRLNLPWVPNGFEVSGIVGDSVYMDKEGREVPEGTPNAKRYVNVTYKVDGRQITNPFEVDTLRLNTLGFEEKPDLTKPTETPSVAEAPKAIEAKAERREEKPAAKPAAPAVTEKPTKEAVQAQINTIKKGDSLVDSLDGTEFLVDDVIKNKSGNITAVGYSYTDDNGNTKYATLDFDAIASILTPQTYTDIKTGERKTSEPGSIKRAKPAAKPAAAAPAEFAPLELEAGRNEALEVEEQNKTLSNIDEHLKKWYGTTAAGEVRKRAAGAGRPVSETAKTEEQRKQESKEANQFNRDVDTAIKIANKYDKRQAIEAFPTKEEWEAAEEVRANNLDVVRGAIYGVSRQPGTSKGVIAAKDYIRNLKPAEREAAQKTYESTRRPPLKPMEAKGRTEYIAEQQLDMEPDLAFYSVDTLKGALVHIVDSPNEVESILAARLLQKDNIGSLKDVDFIVVDKDTKIKDKSVKRMLDKDTVGLTVLDTVGGTVYVRGDSYDEQGINNEIVLHEAMHASGSKKITFAQLAKEQGEPVNKNLAEAVEELEALMGRAKAAYDSKGGNVSAPLKFLNNANAFTDIQEFYAYGLTNADMKEFLLNEVPGVIEKTSGFDDFINVLLRLFGIDPKVKSGLKDLVLISHEIMQAKEPKGAKLAEMAAKANVELINEAKAKETEAEALERKIAASTTPDEILEATSSLIGVAKDPKLIGKAVGRIWKNIVGPKKRSLLTALPTDVLIEIGTEAGIGNLKQIDRDVKQMGTFRTTAMQRMEKVANDWIKLGNKESKKLSKVMHYSTLAQIDPSKDASDPKLNAMWNALTPKAKDIYVRARDFYLDNYRLYLALLNQRLESAGIKGDIKDPTSDRGRLAAAIRAEYEGKAKIAPYFPLMRYGNYWLSIGKGEKREFYMFENEGDRDLFLDTSIARRYRGLTKEQLLASKDIDFGNDVTRLREAATRESSTLRKMFELIDSMASASNEEKARLRDEVFQMHLLTLPDASFRNMFLHRKERAGFSGDALRNFISSGIKFSGQLSRVKYGPKLKNSISAAYDSLEGNPDKGKLEDIVKELSLRVEDQINPPYSDSGFDSFVRFANKFAFMYALTTAKSALNNTFGLATNTVWTLAKHHGLTAATFEMAKFLNPISRQVGIARVNSKGNIEYTFPSVASSKVVRNNPELQRAMQALKDSGILQQTQTFDVWLAQKGKATGVVGTAFEAGVRVTGALFQGVERMTREVAYLAAFNLARKKMGFEDAVNQAIDVVNESLFDYSTWNAPRIIRSPGARLITQFKKFSLYTTVYYARNAYQMIKPLKGQSRVGAMYAFFGSMMTTALLAGVTNAFGVSAVMSIWGMMQGLYNKLVDEEPEDTLKELDIVRWYNNVYLPEWCGDTEIAGMKLSEILSKGVLTAATGYDLSTGISLNNLWFKDIPSAGHWDNAIMDLAESMTGPFINIASTMLSSAKDFAEGDNKKGFEKLIPAAMLRAPAVAYRYKEEGALTKNLDELKAADEFTSAQLFMQGLGFKTAGLAEVTNTNYFISQATRDIEKTRSDLIRRKLKAEERGDEEMLDKVDEQIEQFGDMYPHPDLQIRAKDLREAREARRKAARKMERGLAIEKKFRDFEVLREPGLEKIEEEAAQ